MALPEILTVEDLFVSPVRAAATISPDGTKIAYLAPWKNRLNVWVQSVDADDDARCVTADDNPQRVQLPLDRRLRDGCCTRRTPAATRTGTCIGSTSRTRTLRPSTSRRSPARRPYLELPAGRPGTAIVGLNKRDPALFDAYELDIATGELTLLAENPGNGASWFSSRDGELFALAVTADGDVELSRWDATTEDIAFHRGLRRRRLHAGRLPDRRHPGRQGPVDRLQPARDRTTCGAVGCGHR